MAVLKLKVVVSILAFCAASVVGTDHEDESTRCMSAQTSIDSPVTHYGFATSDGTVVSTMNICTVTHETHCASAAPVVSSVVVHPSAPTVMPSNPAGDNPTVPAGNSQTTYNAQDVTSATGVVPPAEQTGGQSTGAPVVPGIPGTSETVYVPPGDTSLGQQGPNPTQTMSEGTMNPSVTAIISTTDASGNPTVLSTVIVPSVTDSAAVTGSENGYDTSVSGSAEETAEGTPTGTPGVTATGAAKRLAPGAALGVAGMLIAVVF
ncbi:hypothetical protein F53441_6970 [Fusarium austroafricanum]|uniref:Uncharacterized protein n=1 Tax=Fusarium austroafricanum TaxID=2364996 RepID=A0A8H4NVZ2_9HYPO|nr:hypothetical protein F53441_6970 [Fusarium austroafricanum]